MEWNWQQKEWPTFVYQASLIERLEARFLRESGLVLGASRHLSNDDQMSVRIDTLSEEAHKTSTIEGEQLNRASIQSSLCRHFGLEAARIRIPHAEQGVAELVANLYESWDAPLTHTMLWSWQDMLASGRVDLSDVGCYRTHESPMRIVSGYVDAPQVHFEAPPSVAVPEEMELFVEWFNSTAPNSKGELPALTRAALAHLYFASIHPFEDGNGRIARAISEKALSQSLAQPALIALARTIERDRRGYYEALGSSSCGMEVTDWLVYFAETILAAQNETLRQTEFIIAKGRLFARLGDQLNARQEKALRRITREGPDGFQGGLSASNYLSITGASTATTTRDLHRLVEMGALTRTGERKHTRYFLNLT